MEDKEPAEEPVQKPRKVKVPVDEPHWLTGEHYEHIKAEPLAAQHWDARIWRRA